MNALDTAKPCESRSCSYLSQITGMLLEELKGCLLLVQCTIQAKVPTITIMWLCSGSLWETWKHIKWASNCQQRPAKLPQILTCMAQLLSSQVHMWLSICWHCVALLTIYWTVATAPIMQTHVSCCGIRAESGHSWLVATCDMEQKPACTVALCSPNCLQEQLTHLDTCSWILWLWHPAWGSEMSPVISARSPLNLIPCFSKGSWHWCQIWQHRSVIVSSGAHCEHKAEQRYPWLHLSR